MTPDKFIEKYLPDWESQLPRASAGICETNSWD